MYEEVEDPRPDELIASLAELQHGVVDRQQLLARGLRRWRIDNRLRLRQLQRVHRGVYSLGPPSMLGVRGRWMAAVLACGSGAVLSHTDAAALWDLRRSEAGVVHVTVPKRGIAPRRRIRVHVSLTLDAEQSTVHEGIPVTTVARTLVDLADSLDRRSVERAMDQAEVLQLFDMREIERAVEANPGRRGTAVVRRLLEDYRIGAGLTESELEDEFLRLCDRHGIPRPQTQVQVGPDRVDFLWREQRLVVETDGWRWHGGRKAKEEDQQRDIRLQRRGLRVARFSYVRIFREPAGVTSDLHALIAAPSAGLRRAG